MQPEVVLQVLIELWDEWPALVGPAWGDEVYPQVEVLAERLQQAADPVERASLVADLVMLFHGYPAARQRLREAVEARAPTRTVLRGVELPVGDTRVPEWAKLLAALRHRLRPPVVTCYTDITAPRRLAVGQRGVVTVGLTRSPSPESEEATPLEVRLQQFLEVYLRSRQGDFEILSPPVRRLSFEQGQEAEPVVFYIKAMSVGTKSLLLDFRQFGVTIGTVHLAVEVSKEALTEAALQQFADAVQLGGPYAPPPDLEIRVAPRVANGRTELTYTLHSPNGALGFHHQPAGSIIIVGDPETYQQRLMARLEQLAVGRDADGKLLSFQQIKDKLAALGRNLYDELFPQDLRRFYRAFHRKARTLLITSDEPWIPWELVKPYDDSDPYAVIDDDFLCVQFALSRWLVGWAGGAGRIRVQRMACVAVPTVSGHQPLSWVEREQEGLIAMAQRWGVQDCSPNKATWSAVERLLNEGHINLWHFASHGHTNLQHPNESTLLLADGRYLRPEDIHGPRQSHVRRKRPLVFMNACRVGQQAWSLTRLGGWAAAWVDRCRCGAFIGPLWAVNDHLAWRFASRFYEEVEAGKTLAEAVRAARLHVRALAPQNPTWLAYTLYAHPNARVEFGSDEGSSTS